MEINYLHLAYLIKNKCTLPADLDKYISNSPIFIINNEMNELKIKNNLNNDSFKSKLDAEFKKETNVNLNDVAYFEFIKNYYSKSFHKEYNAIIAKVFKEADSNSKGVIAPNEKKKSFFSRFFKSKEPELVLDKDKYNASIFNEMIKNKLDDTDNKYFLELLDLNKFIIFKKEKYTELRELFLSPEFLTEYINIKNTIKESEFTNLSEQLKIDKVREMFKNIIKKVEKIN